MRKCSKNVQSSKKIFFKKIIKNQYWKLYNFFINLFHLLLKSAYSSACHQDSVVCMKINVWGVKSAKSFMIVLRSCVNPFQHSHIESLSIIVPLISWGNVFWMLLQQMCNWYKNLWLYAFYKIKFSLFFNLTVFENLNTFNYSNEFLKIFF